jgi:hypothetical protein
MWILFRDIQQKKKINKNTVISDLQFFSLKTSITRETFEDVSRSNILGTFASLFE